MFFAEMQVVLKKYIMKTFNESLLTASRFCSLAGYEPFASVLLLDVRRYGHKELTSYSARPDLNVLQR